MKISTHIAGSAVALALVGSMLTGASVAQASALTSRSIDTAAMAPAVGTFTGLNAFSAQGMALAVYTGSIDDLENAASAQGATGVWAQDSNGTFQLLPVRGPVFLKAAFATAFPLTPGRTNFAEMTAVTLVR